MVLRKSVNSSFSKLSNLITEEIIMFKKFLSLALVAMLLMSLIAIGASAAQVEVAEEAAAEDVAAQGAEEDVAATGAGVIKFDAASAGWSDAKGINFYIYEIGGEELAAWGSQKKLGGTDEGNGIWSFDAEALGVTSGKQYGIIFQNTLAGQTYDLLMDTSCFGDTASCTGKDIENPVDSNQTGKEAKWANNSLGPIKQITSIGNVVGETIPANKTAKSMMTDFLASGGKDGFDNAKNFQTSKTGQQIIDDVAAALGLTQADVTECIEAAKTTGHSSTGETHDRSGDWDASKSSLPAGGGSSDNNNSNNNSNSNSNSNSSSNSSSKSNSSSSSTKSGSASNTQTGQEENILFIMLGVMVLAAGVIFFVRKKERA